MAIILAIPRLYDAVVARFAAEGTDVEQAFGWREPSRLSAGKPRIVWIPGDRNGNLGKVIPPKYPGGNPRPLKNLDELVTCELMSSQPSDPENERAQYQATRELFCAWLRAVHLAASGTYEVVSLAWVTTRNERRFGAMIRAVLSVQAVIPDSPLQVAPIDVRAIVDLAELDASEPIVVPDPT